MVRARVEFRPCDKLWSTGGGRTDVYGPRVGRTGEGPRGKDVGRGFSERGFFCIFHGTRVVNIILVAC